MCMYNFCFKLSSMTCIMPLSVPLCEELWEGGFVSRAEENDGMF